MNQNTEYGLSNDIYIYIYIYITSIGEGTTPFPGLLHFTLDPYIIILSVSKVASRIIFWVFGMTQPGMEPQSPRPLVSTLLTQPMGW